MPNGTVREFRLKGICGVLTAYTECPSEEVYTMAALISEEVEVLWKLHYHNVGGAVYTVNVAHVIL